MAYRENLDEDALQRCRAYVKALVEKGSLADLWSDFGIIGDIVVRCHLSYIIQTCCTY